MKVDNPYTDLIAVMRRQGAKKNPPSIQIGQVKAIPPNLVISIGELQLDKDNLLIADYLLDGGILQPNDLVAVMPTVGRQKYIILAKVVNL